MMKSYR